MMRCVTRIYSSLLILVFVAGCYGSLLTPAAVAAESTVYLAADSFTWKEFGDDGSRLLKESGTLYGAGFTYMKEFGDHMTLKPAVEIFGGSVDYDGHTQSMIPATTRVDYVGIKLEGDLGRRFRPAQNLFIEPFGGLGLRAWERNLRDGTTADGTPTTGYREEWFTLHARVGVRGGVDFSGRKQLFAEAGVKLPLYNENTAYLSDSTDITLHPGRKDSLFAEAGVKINNFKGSLFYDSMRFSKSNTVITTDGRFFYLNWQPKSTADIYGVKLGFVF